MTFTLKNIFVHESNRNSFQSGKAFPRGYHKGHGTHDNLLIEDGAELISAYVWRGQSFFGRVFSRSAIVSRLARGALLSPANQITIYKVQDRFFFFCLCISHLFTFEFLDKLRRSLLSEGSFLYPAIDFLCLETYSQ